MTKKILRRVLLSVVLFTIIDFPFFLGIEYPPTLLVMSTFLSTLIATSILNKLKL